MPRCKIHLSWLHAWLYMDGQHLRLALQLDVGTLLAHLQGQTRADSSATGFCVRVWWCLSDEHTYDA